MSPLRSCRQKWTRLCQCATPGLWYATRPMRSGLPPTLVESVARVESALRPEAVSPKGALGVMQLMPATARMLDADPHDTAQNIDAGARLLA